MKTHKQKLTEQRRKNRRNKAKAKFTRLMWWLKHGKKEENETP